MTNLTPEQLLAAHKANVETLFGLTQNAFEGVEKLVELNLQVAKAALVEGTDGARAVMSVKDAQELLALQQQMLQPAAEKAAAFGRQLYDIAAATKAGVAKVAEAQVAGMQKALLGMVESAAQSAPAGSEGAVALVRSAMAAAANAMESVHKASRQAAEMADANFKAMAGTAVNAAKSAPGRSRRG